MSIKECRSWQTENCWRQASPKERDGIFCYTSRNQIGYKDLLTRNEK